MTPRVTLIDYGLGNLLSVARAFEHCGAKVEVAEAPQDILNAQRLVLPGVGAFADGMSNLRQLHLVDAIRQFSASGRPMLGICLGMQLIFDTSQEFGLHQGLEIVPGNVIPLPSLGLDGRLHKVPHVGWAELKPFNREVNWRGTILGDLPSGVAAYFVHSFQVHPQVPTHLIATVDFGGHDVPAVVRVGNVYGCQFHPEKSGPVGLQIIQNFIHL